MNTLNKKQQDAYNVVVNKKQNIFLTGIAGSGKSFLLMKLKHDLEIKKYKNVAITSLTGVSANLLSGRTIYSYLGIGLGTNSFSKLFDAIFKNRRLYSIWMRLEVLIIDEISMMTIDLFEKIERLARAVRENEKPFGGIQLVLCGDFLQLPAVTKSAFLFESTQWNKCIQTTIYLTEVIRQADPKFANILNKIRLGEVDDEVEEMLESRQIKYKSKQGFIPTMIYSTNVQVDATNTKYYAKLDSKEYSYDIKYKWHKNIAYKEKYELLMRFKLIVKLKVGAQVMYLINKDALFNGSRGIVTEFINGFPLVLFTCGTKLLITAESLNIEEYDDTVMTYTQLPLKLAYAVSIHKTQGASLSLIRVDFSRVFEYSQLYVALSRVRTIEGLYIRNLNVDLIKSHPKAVQYYKDLELDLI
jgi:ATP-dependent DNA helicase PIF1